MFEPSSWDSDNFTDSLASGISQKYKQPKNIKKKKVNNKEKSIAKGKVSKKHRKQNEKGLNLKKNSQHKQPSAVPLNKMQQNEHMSSINGRQAKDINSENIKDNSHSKKNKYKELSGKVKNVGSDSRIESPIIDIPRKIKFTGKNNTSNVSEWEFQKQNIKHYKKIKKKNQKNFKEKTIGINKDISEQSNELSENNDFILNRKQKIQKQSSIQSDKIMSQSDNTKLSFAENKLKTVDSSVKSPVNKPKLKGQKRKLEKNLAEKSVDEGDVPHKQSKRDKWNKYKDFTKKTLPQQSPQRNTIVLNQSVPQDKTSLNPESILHNTSLPESSPKKNPIFNIDKLKTLLSENTADNDFNNKKTTERNKQKKNPSTLREKMQDRLNAARFRYLNEALYTQTGEEARKLFWEDPQSFLCYHTGFQNQVNKWSKNPVDIAIDYIKARSSKLLVADFGCGEAKIAQSVKNKVVSFDLVAVNQYVTACDMTNVPLDSTSIDIAVFCLSLMGTNLVQYLCEAHRVLKNGGVMVIAEVTSRFEKVGGFIRKVEKLGFSLQKQDKSSKMFMWFEFKKTDRLPDVQRIPNIELSPCVYKKR